MQPGFKINGSSESAPNPLEIVDNFETLGSQWDMRRSVPGRCCIVHEPTISEKPILKITVEPGDLSDGPTERAEITEAKKVRIEAGTEAWYSFFLYVPEDFEINDQNIPAPKTITIIKIMKMVLLFIGGL